MDRPMTPHFSNIILIGLAHLKASGPLVLPDASPATAIAGKILFHPDEVHG